jgi:hypothetical protein
MFPRFLDDFASESVLAGYEAEMHMPMHDHDPLHESNMNSNDHEYTNNDKMPHACARAHQT